MLRRHRGEERGREKVRNRQERGRKKHSRKQDKDRLIHSRRGVSSCVYAGLIFATLIAMIVISCVTKGNAPAWIGGLALVTFFGSWTGIITGFRGFKERDKNYITCKVGVVCNMLLLAGFAGIFIRGLI